MIYPHEQGDEGEAWALKNIATNGKFFHRHSEYILRGGEGVFSEEVEMYTWDDYARTVLSGL